MTLILHELWRNRTAFLIWTAALAFLMSVSILVFPDIHKQAADFEQVFASMGSLSSAFGLDELNFGSLEGFYSVECGNIIGIGGACFAGWLAGGILSREESSRTIEFLLAQPVSRSKVFLTKLAAVFLMITAMNLIVDGTALALMYIVEDSVALEKILRLDFAYYLMQLIIACICFGLSVFIRGNGTGAGLGIAGTFYFLSLIANMTDKLSWLKFLTPFGFCQGSQILSEGNLDVKIFASTSAAALIVLVCGYVYYLKKDIH